MFESFVIMLREGIEAALVIGIILVTLQRTGRRDLERSVYTGLGLAVMGSFGAAIALKLLPVNDDFYDGILYWVSVLFVASMMIWMRAKAKSLGAEIEGRVTRAVQATEGRSRGRESWALGSFAFLMVFREGAEAVFFLTAVNLTTDSMLSFAGSVCGLGLAVAFCVMFVRGSLKVNLQRFFSITEWMLGIFLVQLFINGYHELSEAMVLPATRASMALIGPLVRNDVLFIIAIIALPLFIWLSKSNGRMKIAAEASVSEKRLLIAQVNRERRYRISAVTGAMIILLSLGIAYTGQLMPRKPPPLENVAIKNAMAIVPLHKLDDGKLHRFGLFIDETVVRFLAMRTSDGKYRVGLDACRICGAKGYTLTGGHLVCLNCDSEIEPATLGMQGGCNPIPIENKVEGGYLEVPVKALEGAAPRFANETGPEVSCAVCRMKMKASDAGGSRVFNGKKYYVCKMDKCRAAFKKNPFAYMRYRGMRSLKPW